MTIKKSPVKVALYYYIYGISYLGSICFTFRKDLLAISSFLGASTLPFS